MFQRQLRQKNEQSCTKLEGEQHLWRCDPFHTIHLIHCMCAIHAGYISVTLLNIVNIWEVYSFLMLSSSTVQKRVQRLTRQGADGAV